MKDELLELLYRLGRGRIEPAVLRALTEEVAEACADPRGWLRWHETSGWHERFAAPLWQWVLCRGLPAEVLLRGDTLEALYESLIGGLDEESAGALMLSVDEVAGFADPVVALQAVQDELEGLGHAGGYSLLDFGPDLGEPLQLVLVHSVELPRVLDLCSALGIPAAPSCQALRDAIRLGGR
ncbi:hypothetical protein OOT46_17940 [Aquabacterium sp. A7-Y]|uniref:hypothetical protein n=1 Tax=Aquabacterium sp. A7-Y TaxID=1349605 RepID=UPI00223DEE70|nr:hypothetical protein [Aquabacterium sp. A7-Y]MCW7539722.1 hypothetical protein [Aquabacterium sp. A7-Y]